MSDGAALTVHTVDYRLAINALFVITRGDQEKIELSENLMLDPIGVLPQQRFSTAKLKHKRFAAGFRSIWNRTNVTDAYQRSC